MEKGIKIATLSRLSEERGITKLIYAIPLVKHDVDFYISGDGHISYKNRLLEICNQLNLNLKVHFVGTITSPRQFLKDKTLIINPILIKTGQEYGASDLEVLLQKKVLIRSWDKTQKVLKHKFNVYHVNPTPKEIALAIDYLIDNVSLRKVLVKNGFRTASDLQKKAIKQHFALYKILLNKNE